MYWWDFIIGNCMARYTRTFIHICPQTKIQTHWCGESQPTRYIFKWWFCIIRFLARVNFDYSHIYLTLNTHIMFLSNRQIPMDHQKAYEDKLESNLCFRETFSHWKLQGWLGLAFGFALFTAGGWEKVVEEEKLFFVLNFPWKWQGKLFYS